MSTICRAVLSSGSQHDDVYQLGRLLDQAGYPNSVSEGTNPFGLVDESIIRAADEYRRAHKVDPEDAIPGVSAAEAGRWIGPNLWDALLGPLDGGDQAADEPEPAPEPKAPARKRSSSSRSRSTAAKRKR